jgi:hypothetical protein
MPILATRCHDATFNEATASFIRIWDLDFGTFLRNPPFGDVQKEVKLNGDICLNSNSNRHDIASIHYNGIS